MRKARTDPEVPYITLPKRKHIVPAMQKGRRLAAPPFLSGSTKSRRSLLELDGAAGFLDLLLDLLGLVLVDAFLDGLRRAFDERLGFAQAEAGDGADFLDDVDLLATVAGEDHVELGLLFSGRSRAGAAAGGRRCNRSGGRDAPL